MKTKNRRLSTDKSKDRMSPNLHASKIDGHWKWKLLINTPICLHRVFRNQEDLGTFKRLLQENGFQLEENTDSLSVLRVDRPLLYGFTFRGEIIVFFMANPVGSVRRPKCYFSGTLSEELVLLLEIANRLYQSPRHVYHRRHVKPVEAKYVHTEKTKRLGITTSEKRSEDTIIPLPINFESESQSSFNVDLGAFQRGVKTAQTQRSRRRIVFNKLT